MAGPALTLTQPRRVACAQAAPSKGRCGALPEQQPYVSSPAAARGGFIKLRGADSPLAVALGVVWGGVGAGVSLALRCAASEA